MKSAFKIRILLYCVIAMVTTLIHDLAPLDAEVMTAMLWPQWVVIAMAPVLSAAIAVRAFFDQTISRTKKEPTSE